MWHGCAPRRHAPRRHGATRREPLPLPCLPQNRPRVLPASPRPRLTHHHHSLLCLRRPRAHRAQAIMRFLARLAASPTLRPAAFAAGFTKVVLVALELFPNEEDIVVVRICDV